MESVVGVRSERRVCSNKKEEKGRQLLEDKKDESSKAPLDNREILEPSCKIAR